MKKNKIYNKIEELKDEAIKKEDQVRAIANSNHFDAPKIAELCNQVGVILNQVEILKECVS